MNFECEKYEGELRELRSLTWQSLVPDCQFDNGLTDDVSMAYSFYKDRIVTLASTVGFHVFLRGVFTIGYVAGMAVRHKSDMSKPHIIMPDKTIHLV